MDGLLCKRMDQIRQRITTKDFDYVLVVDGDEGSGKSTFAQQLAKYVDHSFNINRIYFDAKSFADGIMKSRKYKAHVFDEAFSGLSSRNSLGEVNQMLTSLIMEMRQRNLFVIIVLPTIFMLDKYAAMFRSKILIHCYVKKGKRGNFVVFTKDKKRLLILTGKKSFSYRYPKSGFFGKFTGKYVVDEQDYKDKKLEAMQKRKRSNKSTKAKKYEEQRNKLIRYLYKNQTKSIEETVHFCAKVGFSISKSNIGRIVNEKEDT